MLSQADLLTTGPPAGTTATHQVPAVAIADAELRLDAGGRRVARRETYQLAQLRQQQEADRVEMYARASRARSAGTGRRPPAEQERVVAAAQQIADSGGTALRAAAEHDAARLAQHQADTLALQDSIMAGETELQIVRDALDRRLDVDGDENAPAPAALPSIPGCSQAGPPR